MAQFTKKDLIEAIEDTVKRELSTGQKDKNRISDLATLIKGAVATNTADDEIKAIVNNLGDLHTMFEDIADKIVKQTNEVKNVTLQKTFKQEVAERGGSNLGGMMGTIAKRMSNFAGSTTYDVFNLISDGQLGVMRSMVDTVLRASGTVTKMTSAAGKLYSGFSEKVETVFADEKRHLVDPVVDISKGIGDALNIDGLKSKEKRSLEIAEDSNKTLKKIYKIQTGMSDTIEDQYKWNLRQRSIDWLKKIKAFFTEVLMFLGGAVGFLLGGVVAQITTRFQALYLMIKTAFAPFVLAGKVISNSLVKPLKAIGASFIYLAEMLTGTKGLGDKLKNLFTIFDRIPKLNFGVLRNITILSAFFARLSNLKPLTDLGKVGTGVAKAIAWIANAIFKVTTTVRSWIGSFKVFMSGGTFLAKLFGQIASIAVKIGNSLKVFLPAFKFGMRVLGWPLTILMGVIDFIKGFMNTEGSLAEKVMGGLKTAIMGIIEMPLKIIGWVFDKLTGSEGSGQKIVDFVGGWIDAFFGGIVSVLMSLWDSAKALGSNIADIIGGIIDLAKNVWNFFIALKEFDLDKLGEAVDGIWEGIKSIIGGIIGGLFNITMTLPNMFLSYLQSLWPKIQETATGTIFEPFVWFFTQVGSIVKSIFDEVMGAVKKIPFIGDAIKSDVEKRTESIEKTEKLRRKLEDVKSGKDTSYIGLTTFKDETKKKEKAEEIAKLESQIAEQEKETQKYSDKATIKLPESISKPSTPGMISDAVAGFKNMTANTSIPSPSKVASSTASMGKDAIAGAKTMMGSSTATTVAGSTQYDAQINAAAQKYGVSPDLVKAVMKQESGFNPNAVNKKSGAAGLMQFMPATAKDMGITDRLDPAQSIDGGAKYLAQLSKRFGGDIDKTLAAYNWGMGNVEKKGMGAMPAETVDYLKKVKGNMPVGLAKTTAPTGLGSTVNEAEVAKANVIKKQMDQTNGINDSLAQLNKTTGQRSEAPLVVNTGGGDDRRDLEPPTDIESMSILWLNKSWGLG